VAAVRYVDGAQTLTNLDRPFFTAAVEEEALICFAWPPCWSSFGAGHVSAHVGGYGTSPGGNRFYGMAMTIVCCHSGPRNRSRHPYGGRKSTVAAFSKYQCGYSFHDTVKASV